MTAALLRNELFHHLLASNPEGTNRDSFRAGALALVFHAVLVLLLLQVPPANMSTQDLTMTTPIILENITLPEIAGPSGGTPGGGNGGPSSIRPPEVLPPVGPPMPPSSYRIGDQLKPMNFEPTLPVGAGGGSNSGDGESTGNFTVVQHAPRMLNADRVSALLRREYPHQFMQAGIGGTVVLHVLINPGGQVIDARVAQSSGTRALDEAALRVSREMLFSPAQNRDEAVRVWAEIPVVFSARD